MHFRTLKMIATSGFLTALECTKFVFVPDPTGGAQDTPRDPLVGWRREYSLPILHHTWRLRRLDFQGGDIVYPEA